MRSCCVHRHLWSLRNSVKTELRTSPARSGRFHLALRGLRTTAGSSGHVPVLVNEVCEMLRPPIGKRQPVLVDATVGAGGHAFALLTRYPELRLVGLDRDASALRLAEEKLSAFR